MRNISIINLFNFDIEINFILNKNYINDFLYFEYMYMYFRKGLWILFFEERNFKFCWERIIIIIRRWLKIIIIVIDERDVYFYVYI